MFPWGSFSFKLRTWWDLSLEPTVSILTAMPEFNTMFGFDPVRSGTDVCKHHGWPLLEIFDVSESKEGVYI